MAERGSGVGAPSICPACRGTDPGTGVPATCDLGSPSARTRRKQVAEAQNKAAQGDFCRFTLSSRAAEGGDGALKMSQV